jgi:hypothetical protein
VKKEENEREKREKEKREEKNIRSPDRNAARP